jgi:hypothetical protein
MASERPSDTFETFITKERERLAKQKEDILAHQEKLAEELAGIEKELAAIAAYEEVKLGRAPQTRRATKPRASSAPRGSRRQDVLELLQKQQDGLSRGEILKAKVDAA